LLHEELHILCAVQAGIGNISAFVNSLWLDDFLCSTLIR